MFVSVISPVYNEAPNVVEFLDGLFSVLESLNHPFEVIVVDDGSTDGSLELLKKEAVKRPELKLLVHYRNYGQTAAIMAAIDHSSGDVIVPIDADLQNDPTDIPMMLDLLSQGLSSPQVQCRLLIEFRGLVGACREPDAVGYGCTV